MPRAPKDTSIRELLVLVLESRSNARSCPLSRQGHAPVEPMNPLRRTAQESCFFGKPPCAVMKSTITNTNHRLSVSSWLIAPTSLHPIVDMRYYRVLRLSATTLQHSVRAGIESVKMAYPIRIAAFEHQSHVIVAIAVAFIIRRGACRFGLSNHLVKAFTNIGRACSPKHSLACKAARPVFCHLVLVVLIDLDSQHL